MDRERRSARFRSWIKKLFKSSSQTKLKISHPLELDPASSANKDPGQGHIEHELPPAIKSENKPGASSEARDTPVQASDSQTPDNADAGSITSSRRAVSIRNPSGVPTAQIPSAGDLAGGNTEAVVSIVELWNQAFEELREKDPKLIERYEKELSRSVSTMVGTTVTMSGLGKVRRKEQMEVLVKRKLEEDENGGKYHLETIALESVTWLDVS